MKKKILLIVTCVLLFMPFGSQAAAYWLQVLGSGKTGDRVVVRLYYGSINDYGIRVPDKGAELKLAGDFQFVLHDPRGNSIKLPLTLNEDCWETSFTPSVEGTYSINGFNDQHPVVDRSNRGGINIKPVDYLIAVYVTKDNITPSDVPPSKRLYLTTSRDSDFIVVKGFFNGVSCKPGTKVRVFNPDNWEKELSLDSGGQARFFAKSKGLYIIRLDWDETVKGNFKGTAYEQIRHRCNLYLEL